MIRYLVVEEPSGHVLCEARDRYLAQTFVHHLNRDTWRGVFPSVKVLEVDGVDPVPKEA
jgi:hypothetical protein